MKVTKKLADKLMLEGGKTKGISFKPDGDYIRIRTGKEGLVKLEKRMKELGHPLSFRNINLSSYYPLGLQNLYFLLCKELFKWTDKDIFDMGYNSLKLSIIIKMIAKFFLSPEKALSYGPSHWRDYNDLGTLTIPVFDKKRKTAKVVIKDFPTRKLMCKYLQGYFLSFAELAVIGKDRKLVETKCDGKNHEFLLTWK